MCTPRPGEKAEGAAGAEIIWGPSPEAWPAAPRPGWRHGSESGRAPAPRPPAPAPAAAGAPSPRPGRSQATAGGQRPAVSPPPARPQGRGRCQGDGTGSPRGARLLPRPKRLGGPALAAPRSGEEQRGRGTAGSPPTYLRARAATPGGQRHPEPPQSLLPPPPETPLRKRDHWSEATTIPDMVPPSAPPTSPFPPRRPAIRRLLGSGSAPSPIVCTLESCASVVSTLKCPIRKIGFRDLVPRPKTAGDVPQT